MIPPRVNSRSYLLIVILALAIPRGDAWDASSQVRNLRRHDPLSALTQQVQKRSDLAIFMKLEGLRRRGATGQGDANGPLMSAKDVKLFSQVLDGATHYQEFGSGGSTELALSKPNIRKIHTVESDTAWVTSLSEHHSVHDAIASGRLRLVHANIGPVRDFGNPVNEDHKTDWPKYSGEYAQSDVLFDTILVDGRFRVACFLKALRRLAPAQRGSTTLLIHDYVTRPHYHAVEKFADVIGRGDELTLFRSKPDFDKNALDRAIAEYEYTYA